MCDNKNDVKNIIIYRTICITLILLVNLLVIFWRG